MSDKTRSLKFSSPRRQILKSLAYGSAALSLPALAVKTSDSSS